MKGLFIVAALVAVVSASISTDESCAANAQKVCDKGKLIGYFPWSLILLTTIYMMAFIYF